MKKEEFLIALEDILQRDEKCNEDDILNTFDEWDSLSKMSLVAYFDKNFGLQISLNQFSEMNLVSDLIKLAGDNIK